MDRKPSFASTTNWADDVEAEEAELGQGKRHGLGFDMQASNLAMHDIGSQKMRSNQYRNLLLERASGKPRPILPKKVMTNFKMLDVPNKNLSPDEYALVNILAAENRKEMANMKRPVTTVNNLRRARILLQHMI